MNCKAPSKLLHTLTHTLQCFLPCNTEGIRRGLCNKERTKQFKYGCGINVSTGILHTQTRSLLRFMTGETALTRTGTFADRTVRSQPRFTGITVHHTVGRFHHAATSWALPRGPFQNDSPRYGSSQSGPRSLPCFGECVCVHMLGVFAWKDERLHCQLVSNYTCCLCVFLWGGQLRAVLWRTACVFCPPLCVLMCTFITVKSGCSKKIRRWGRFVNRVTGQPD